MIQYGLWLILTELLHKCIDEFLFASVNIEKEISFKVQQVNLVLKNLTILFQAL